MHFIICLVVSWSDCYCQPFALPSDRRLSDHPSLGPTVRSLSVQPSIHLLWPCLDSSSTGLTGTRAASIGPTSMMVLTRRSWSRTSHLDQWTSMFWPAGSSSGVTVPASNLMEAAVTSAHQVHTVTLFSPPRGSANSGELTVLRFCLIRT